MPMSDDTILRYLKRRVKACGSERKTRVVGVDDWAWRKGSTYGTIIVDLEQRAVVDLIPERAAGMTVDRFKKHPGVEIISRDRCGSFAQGAANRRSVSHCGEHARRHSDPDQPRAQI
ncbi:MAG: transposase family protein [Methylocystaceae bacterium]|nr:MAG: transposase family protein [Methylocystaceae bacterium]KAF0206638.1 MAG: transposase family [Methylocystaceae bacterium]